MNYFNMFLKNMKNNICFNCGDANIFEGELKYWKMFECKHCISYFQVHGENYDEGKFGIEINENYYLIYKSNNELTLMKDVLYSSGGAKAMYNVVVCKLPISLLNKMPVKLSDIEKYIILL